jgi:hypothetical protein
MDPDVFANFWGHTEKVTELSFTDVILLGS